MTRRRESFSKAVGRLGEALSGPPDALRQDAAIQRFEFCFELAWKCVQETARTEGLDCASPKDCLKAAYRKGWLKDEHGWLAMLEDRNRTSHTYDERLAAEVFSRLPQHQILLQSLLASLP